MGRELFEVKYQEHKIRAEDEGIAWVLETYFKPVISSYELGGELYSISERDIDKILDSDNLLTPRGRKVLKAIKRRAKELGGGFDILWTW